MAGQLGGQPGLADAGLALDHHQPPVAGHARVRGQQRRPLPLPPDQRHRLGGVDNRRPPRPRCASVPHRGSRQRHPGYRRGRGRGRGRGWGWGWVGGWGEAVGLERLVDRDRLLQRLDPQLLLQDPLAGLELAQGGPAPPAPAVDPHELAVGRLVQRVEGQPAAGGVDRVVPAVLADLGRGQPLQGPRELAAQPFGLEVLPVVEAGAVAEAEPGQEVAPVQPGRLGQRGQAGRAGVGGRVAVVPAAGHQLLEPRHVQPEARLGEPDGGPVRGQPPGPDGLVEG